MYEFSKKEIRKEFKKTPYGSKTCKYLYISIIVFAAVVILPVIVGVCLLMTGRDIDAIFDMMLPFAGTYSSLLFISMVCMCYFDGKRDGAIEVFKSNLK